MTVGASTGIARHPLSKIQRRIYDCLVEAANRGIICPTNNCLADLTGAMSASTASTAMAEIERKGWIIVQRGNMNRVVTIVDTGRSTAGEVTSPHWRQGKPAAPPTKRRYVRTSPANPVRRPEIDHDLPARIERDQAARLAERQRWLELEQQRYGLPRRARLIDEMPA